MAKIDSCITNIQILLSMERLNFDIVVKEIMMTSCIKL